MVTLARTHDPDAVLVIANKSYSRKIELRHIDDAVRSDLNFCLISEFGCMLFHPGRDNSQPGDYGMTLMLTPGGAGQWGRDFVVAAFDWMFTNTPALRLVGLSLGREAQAIRINYTPKGGRVERVKPGEHPQATIRWTFEKDAWLNRSKSDAATSH